MKNAIITILTLVTAFMITSCSGLRKATGTEEIVSVACASEVDWSGTGIVDIDITATVPEDFRNPNTGILLVPELVSKDGTKKISLFPCVAEGILHNTFNDRKGIYEPDLTDNVDVRKRYVRNGVTSLESRNTVTFEEWMAESSVRVDIYADAYCRRVLLQSETFPVSVADPNAFAELIYLEKYYHVRQTTMQETTDSSPLTDGFLFRVDSYSIDDKNIRTELAEYVRNALSPNDLKDYSVFVEVSNSPDGSMEYNRNLSNNRIQTVKDLLSESGIDIDKCEFSVIVENWAGVRQAVSERFSENKDAILAVVDSIADLDLREHIIRNKFYREWTVLRHDVYPDLRYCSLEITGSIIPDSFQMSGNQVRESEPKDKADAIALNESMLEKVMAGDYKGAESVADKISNTGIPEKILYNKALVYLKTGRNDEAGALLRRCTGIKEARYNLAVLYIMSRDYAAAEPLLEDYDCINKAVVKVALGKDAEARDILILLPNSAAKARLTEMLEK